MRGFSVDDCGGGFENHPTHSVGPSTKAPRILRGGKLFSERINLIDFTMTLDEDEEPVEISCPYGKTGVEGAGRKAELFMPTFMRFDCVDCPLLVILSGTAVTREIANVRYPAQASLRPMYEPKNKRVRF